MAVGARLDHSADRRIGDAIRGDLRVLDDELADDLREFVEVRGLRIVRVLEVGHRCAGLAPGARDLRLDRVERGLEGLLARDVMHVLVDERAVRDIELRPLDVCRLGGGWRGDGTVPGGARGGHQAGDNDHEDRAAHPTKDRGASGRGRSPWRRVRSARATPTEKRRSLRNRCNR